MDANDAPPETIQSLKEDVERLAWKAKKKLLESSNLFLDSFVDTREPFFDDLSFVPFAIGIEQQVAPNYDILNRGEAVPYYLHDYGLKLFRDQSRRLCGYNEFAINARENRAAYVIGDGITYKAVRRDDDPQRRGENASRDPLCRAVQDVIDQFRDINDWPELEGEISERCDRDGEVFLRLFPQLDGMTLVREIEPEHVRTAYLHGMERRYLFGIETSPEDVQDVLAYWVMSDPLNGVADERVDAEEVVHIKLNTDRNSKRGFPTFLPVRKNLERADKLLRNMSMLAQIRATFALIRKHDGYSVAAVQAFVDSQIDATVTSPLTNKPQNFQFYQPGSVVDVPKGTDYEMPSVNTNAAELVEILNAELRAVAARLNFPVWMLTADASDMGAYSSSWVAESPSVKNFERLRQKYLRAFGVGCYSDRTYGRKVGVLWRAIRNAVLAGILPERALTDVEITAEGPSLIVRDQLQEAQKNQILHTSGVLSAQTWAQQSQLDWEREQSNLDEEAERNGPALAGLPMPDEEQPEPRPTRVA